MNDLTVSIIVCTHNRCSYLKKVIESLLQQTYSANAYEIVVVDNASTDGTKEYVEGILKDDDHFIQYVYEPKLGVSQARNAGARFAKSAILAFIDDDAVADPTWLATQVNALESEERVVCVAGKIDLLWEVPEPSWMPKELYGYLGDNTSWGDNSQELLLNRNPHEGNMAVWKWALQAAGGFDTHFGPVGGNLGRNEGIKLADQLRSLGKILYAPGAIVHHCIPPLKATKRYLIRLGFMQGIANAELIFLRNPRSRLRLIRSFMANIWFLAQEITAMVKHWLQEEPRKAFAYRIFIIIRLGQMWQTLRMAFGKSLL